MIRHYLNHWSMGILNGSVHPECIAKVIEELPGVGPVRIRLGDEPGRALLVFQDPATEGLRGLQCATGDLAIAETGDLVSGPRTFLRIVDEGCAREAVKRIVEHFGGLYRPTDASGGDWEQIAPPGDTGAPAAPAP